MTTPLEKEVLAIAARIDRMETDLITIDDHIAAAVFDIREQFRRLELHLDRLATRKEASQ